MAQANGSHNINDWNAGLSAEQRTANAKVAAAASAEARRAHRLFKDILKDVLTADLSKDDEMTKALETLGLKPTHENALMLASVLKAKTGDIEAVRFVRDTLGEKPTEAFNLSVSDRPIKSLDLGTLTDQELEALADQADARSDE